MLYVAVKFIPVSNLIFAQMYSDCAAQLLEYTQCSCPLSLFAWIQNFSIMFCHFPCLCQSWWWVFVEVVIEFLQRDCGRLILPEHHCCNSSQVAHPCSWFVNCVAKCYSMPWCTRCWYAIQITVSFNLLHFCSDSQTQQVLSPSRQIAWYGCSTCWAILVRDQAAPANIQPYFVLLFEYFVL